MNRLLEESSGEENSLNRDKAVKLLWEWRKYRNGVMYDSVYRWGAASLALAIAPYLLPNLIGELGFAVLVFPAVASILSFFAAYLIAVQYRLYKQVDREFRLLLGEYAPEDLPRQKVVDRLLTISFGRVLPGAFLCFSLFVQFASALVLSHLVHSSLS